MISKLSLNYIRYKKQYENVNGEGAYDLVHKFENTSFESDEENSEEGTSDTELLI